MKDLTVKQVLIEQRMKSLSKAVQLRLSIGCLQNREGGGNLAWKRKKVGVGRKIGV